MANSLALLLMSFLWPSLVSAPSAAQASFPPQTTSKIEVVYNGSKDKTTVSLAPVRISGEKDKYHSLHMSPSFSFPGHEPLTPEIINFELRTVVKGKLKIDLYVLFIVDGEKIFLSSSRSGVKRGSLGRGWMAERLVFRMPYETFVKVTKAKDFQIAFDGLKFSVGETQKQALREFLTYMKPDD